MQVCITSTQPHPGAPCRNGSRCALNNTLAASWHHLHVRLAWHTPGMQKASRRGVAKPGCLHERASSHTLNHAHTHTCVTSCNVPRCCLRLNTCVAHSCYLYVSRSHLSVCRTTTSKHTLMQADQEPAHMPLFLPFEIGGGRIYMVQVVVMVAGAQPMASTCMWQVSICACTVLVMANDVNMNSK